MLQRFGILVSAAALAVTAACSQSDPGITTAVKTKMAADDTVKAYQINVDTSNHVVTLTGSVDNPAAKDQAVVIARQTKGVTDVVDHISVGGETAPTSGAIENKSEAIGHDIADAAHDAKVSTEHAADKAGEAITDAAITSDVKTKFLAEPGVSGLSIKVDTDNGVVTLSGMVKTKAEAEKAVSIARDSAGVKQVVNHMRIG